MGGYDIWRQGAAQAQCVPHARRQMAHFPRPTQRRAPNTNSLGSGARGRGAHGPPSTPQSRRDQFPAPMRVCPALPGGPWARLSEGPLPAGWLGRLEPSSQQGLVLMAVRPTLSRGAALIPPSGATALRLVPGAYAASSEPGTDQSRVRASFVASARGAPPHPHPNDPAVITRCAYAISPPAATA